MNRLLRLLAIMALTIGLAVPAFSQSQNANDAGFAPAEVPVEEDGGDPLYGYLACGLLCAICIFAVSKSSRRS